MVRNHCQVIEDAALNMMCNVVWDATSGVTWNAVSAAMWTRTFHTPWIVVINCLDDVED